MTAERMSNILGTSSAVIDAPLQGEGNRILAEYNCYRAELRQSGTHVEKKTCYVSP